MKYLTFAVIAIFAILLCSCGSAPSRTTEPPYVEQVPEPEITEARIIVPPADYTKDWESITALAGEVEYSPYITQIAWKRRNWQMALSGEWIDDIIEDYMRLKRWRDKLKKWTSEKGKPEWEY